MKITIIYDNTAVVEGLKASWGFSCLVDAYGMRILFDAGADGPTLLGNMGKLGIEPSLIDAVFVSHDHWDHTGGLADLFAVRPVRCYVPASCREPQGARDVVAVGAPVELCGGISSTGELGGCEQSLVVDTGAGVAVIAGCSHPGVGTILEAARRHGTPRALVGGLHGFDEFSLLTGLGLVCPTHCTQHSSEIRGLYPDACVSGGAGTTLEL